MRMLRPVLALAGVAALLTTGAPLATADGVRLEAGEPSVAAKVQPKKINVMGLWAHPDDDASFVTPCGVWHDKFDVQCGIIMLTRGEGGSNSVGDESGPDLGLRRENEDRISHYRSGTVDIFNIDAVDFFYNTSSPLTEEMWGSERIQRQVVHVIRQTRPDILTGFQPTPAGHGNHQYAGRVIWEAARLAADPSAFPEQLTGADAVQVWQVKQILTNYSARNTPGTGGQAAEQCNTGFTPNANAAFTVVGTWTGYNSPYTWPEGNVQGQQAGSPMTWAQVGREGYVAHPTQARSKLTTVQQPACERYGILDSKVPFQPAGSAGNGRDDAVLYGSVIADPGGFPLDSTFAIDVDSYFQAPGEPFDLIVKSRSGGATIPAGEVKLTLPAGWTSTTAQLGPISKSAEATATLRVTPPADATLGRHQIGVTFTSGGVTAYNNTRVEIVPGVQGRFQRWGNFAEYEQWAEKFTYVAGRSAAERQIGAGESVTIPVVVTNRTDSPASGRVSLTVEAPLSLAEDSIEFSNLAPGEQKTVSFTLTHTDPSAPGGRQLKAGITTTSAAGTSSETLTLYEVPTTVIPQAETAPKVDGAVDAAGYGPELDISRVWEGSACDPDGVDCGAGSTARLAWHGDDLYVVAKVVDDRASAAATIDRCFGHWLVDSVEVLLDPMSGSRDTSSTFKTGIMPFTDDPQGKGGNGPNGACWSRDADNHQGFSSGPLAGTIEDAPNSPGQEVAVSIERTADGAIVNGSYIVETRIPLGNLPAAVVTGTAPTGDAGTNEVDARYLGLNVTPYDSDVTTFIGDTRMAWSPFGSQQSEPYRWGHAYLDGYKAPADRPATAKKALIPDTALMGVESPQTIFQSATRGVTISGLPGSSAASIDAVNFRQDGADLRVTSSRPGTLRVYAWAGSVERPIPVWKTSCKGDELGFGTCSDADKGAAPWTGMGGRLLASEKADVSSGSATVGLALTGDQLTALGKDGHLLVSFQAEGDSAVNAWHYPVGVAGPEPTPTPTPTPTPEPSPTPSKVPSPTASPTGGPAASPTQRPNPGPPSTGR